MSNVKVLKMLTGEDLLSEVKDSDDGNLILKNPCMMVPGQDGGIGIAPWAFMAKDAEIVHGPYVSMNELAQRRTKRRNIQLVQKVK